MDWRRLSFENPRRRRYATTDIKCLKDHAKAEKDEILLNPGGCMELPA